MIKPPPETLETEKGRVFEFELGRKQQILAEGRTMEELDELRE